MITQTCDLVVARPSNDSINEEQDDDDDDFEDEQMVHVDLPRVRGLRGTRLLISLLFVPHALW